MNSLTAVIAAIVPIVLGGITTYFKIFVTPKDEFRQRTKLRRAAVKERLASRLTGLLQHVRALAADDVLRGDGREEPDLVGDYTEEAFRAFTLCGRLTLLDGIIKYSYFLLYATIVSGLCVAFVGWLVPSSPQWVLGFAITLVAVQVIIVFVVQLAASRLDEYEDVT